MLLITYDIKSDKTRTKFSKFITKYGYRLQYSVYKINNSDRILNIIDAVIENEFKPLFSEEDSIMIFKIDSKNELRKYGFAKHQDSDIIFID